MEQNTPNYIDASELMEAIQKKMKRSKARLEKAETKKNYYGSAWENGFIAACEEMQSYLEMEITINEFKVEMNKVTSKI